MVPTASKRGGRISLPREVYTDRLARRHAAGVSPWVIRKRRAKYVGSSYPMRAPMFSTLLSVSTSSLLASAIRRSEIHSTTVQPVRYLIAVVR